MKCSSKKCEITASFLLNTIDDGEKLIALCPNDCIFYAIGGLKESDLEFYPSEVKSKDELFCEITNTLKLDVKDDEKFYIYKTENHGEVLTLHLSEKFLFQLLLLNLEPKAYFVLKEKHGIFHEIHDDFYDEEDGYALQPVEIE